MALSILYLLEYFIQIHADRYLVLFIIDVPLYTLTVLHNIYILFRLTQTCALFYSLLMSHYILLQYFTILYFIQINTDLCLVLLIIDVPLYTLTVLHNIIFYSD